MRRKAAVREGVSTAAHTVRSGDAGGSGSSIDLSEGE
jgi:type IV secretion system protein TrbL